MNYDDESALEDDTIRMGLKSQRAPNLFQESKRFETITKLLYTPKSISPYKNPLLTRGNYEQSSETEMNDILLSRIVIINNQ